MAVLTCLAQFMVLVPMLRLNVVAVRLIVSVVGVTLSQEVLHADVRMVNVSESKETRVATIIWIVLVA